jgi:hypothetical protein
MSSRLPRAWPRELRAGESQIGETSSSSHGRWPESAADGAATQARARRPPPSRPIETTNAKWLCLSARRRLRPVLAHSLVLCLPTPTSGVPAGPRRPAESGSCYVLVTANQELKWAAAVCRSCCCGDGMAPAVAAASANWLLPRKRAAALKPTRLRDPKRPSKLRVVQVCAPGP